LKAVTERGEIPVKVNLLQRSPDLLIVLAQDALLREDYPNIRKYVADIYKAAHIDVAIQLGILRHEVAWTLPGHSGTLLNSRPCSERLCRMTVLRPLRMASAFSVSLPLRWTPLLLPGDSPLCWDASRLGIKTRSRASNNSRLQP
jgi:hypothetical protein